MRSCCPPNHGCNAHDTQQPCVLTIFRTAADTTEEARRALERWDALELTEHEGAGAGERRFRRRAYERAREQALTAAAMDLAAEPPRAPRRGHRRRRTARGVVTRRGRSGPARTVNA
jgi:hypothetical protein